VPDARCYRIDPGTVLVLDGVALSPGDLQALVAELARVCGHTEFLVLPVASDANARFVAADQVLDFLAATGIQLGAPDTDAELCPRCSTPWDGARCCLQCGLPRCAGCGGVPHGGACPPTLGHDG
jgi:hypothetical protein